MMVMYVQNDRGNDEMKRNDDDEDGTTDRYEDEMMNNIEIVVFAIY